MELNPRHKIRVLASVELSTSLLNIIQKYDLDYGEIFVMLSKIIQNWSYHLQKDQDKNHEKSMGIHNK